MTTHLGLMIVFALFVSVVFAALMRDEPRQQLRFAARLMGAFVAAAIVGGWLLYPMPF